MTPLEVKSVTNVHGKSIANFAQANGIDRCVRLSRKGLKDEGWLINVPLSMANAVGDLLG